MSPAEHEALRNPALSHVSRVLYLLLLRPAAERGLREMSVTAAATFLDSPDSSFPFAGTMANVKLCLKELIKLGLIAPEPDENENSDTITLELPYFESQAREAPKEAFTMTLSWRPGPSFAKQALYWGLPMADFSEDELRSFISFWLDKKEYRTQNGWERAFASRLKKRQSAF